MANNCITDVTVHGDLGSLSVLHSVMEKCMEKGAVVNDWGNNWLGNLVTLLGEDWQKIYCRGYFYDVMLCEDTQTLRFFTDTAWVPMTEVFHMIERHLPGLKVYYSAEEPGCEVYVTNDSEGKFYPDRYLVEWYTPHGCEEPFYFKTRSEALRFISEEAGRPVTSEEQVDMLSDEWQEQDENCFVCLRSFYVENDG